MKFNRQNCLLSVSAIIEQENKILLVEQKWPNVSHTAWSLPGGVVEVEEFLHDALKREVKEETGLTVTNQGRLLYLIQHQKSFNNNQLNDQTLTFIFDKIEWQGDINTNNDPDGLIQGACFMSYSESIQKLQETLTWAPRRDPIIAYLQKRVEIGTVWIYQKQSDGSDILVAPQISTL